MHVTDEESVRDVGSVLVATVCAFTLLTPFHCVVHIVKFVHHSLFV